MPLKQRHQLRAASAAAVALLLAAPSGFSTYLEARVSADRASSFCIGASALTPVRQSNACTHRRAEKKTGITPVVDDSDLDNLDDDKSAGSSDGKTKKTTFNSLLADADSFTKPAERSNRKALAPRVSLEDELRGLSLEDDTDLDVMMMGSARGGKSKDVALSYRVNRWFEETKELILNPSKIQITYGIVFLSIVATLLLTGVITFALGGFRLEGDGVETARRRVANEADAFTQRKEIQRENRRRFAEMEDVRPYFQDLRITLNPDSKINFRSKRLIDVKPEDVIDKI
eukprot:TRINITY_DN33593_c0_g1_i1.p1 TRINITY_DN33593_c0_g1~~TRINITY_DN33593_c0_g1_i1.p1  ORF type:complete len:288 (+),score=56.34 TRINITY_DN33593_c0_g1_i1:59-922(+)